MKWLKNKWDIVKIKAKTIKLWIPIITLLIVALILCIIIVYCGNPSHIEKARSIIQLYSEFLSPTAIVLGLVLGYPLLKRKLVDEHITKQFEIINEANRKVKNEALRLKVKYPIDGDSTSLSKEYLISVYEDVRSLNELSFDANSVLYKYTELMRRALHLYIKEYDNHIGEKGIVQEGNSMYIINRDTLKAWMQYHLVTIFEYARTMQEVPTESPKKRQYEEGDVSRFLTENTFYEIESLDPTISYYYNSQYIMKYQENNNKSLSSKRDWLFFKYCYSSVKTTKAMARMMYKNKIYIPLVLRKVFNEVLKETLCLVGYNESGEVNPSTGQTVDTYVCFYASIDVLDSTSNIKEPKDLDGFVDPYIERSFDMSMFEIKDSKHHMIRVEIQQDKAKENYKLVEKKLISNMENEMKE